MEQHLVEDTHAIGFAVFGLCGLSYPGRQIAGASPHRKAAVGVVAPLGEGRRGRSSVGDPLRSTAEANLSTPSTFTRGFTAWYSVGSVWGYRHYGIFALLRLSWVHLYFS